MDLCDLPFTVKAQIASYLCKKDILKICHVSRKWYHSFNENYLFKNSRPEPDTSFKQDELNIMRLWSHFIQFFLSERMINFTVTVGGFKQVIFIK